MADPRFLLLELPVTVTSAGLRAGVAGTRTAWRLVAGNNHVLGRVPEPLEDLEACRAALARLRAGVDRLTTGDRPGSRPGRWGWELRLGADVVAVSSRWYERQREALRSVEAFLDAVPVAGTSERIAVRPILRQLRRPDLLVPRDQQDEDG